MNSSSVSPTTISLLQKVSIATLCTCLFKRGLRNQVIQGAVPVGGAAKPTITLPSAGGEPAWVAVKVRVIPPPATAIVPVRAESPAFVATL